MIFIRILFAVAVLFPSTTRAVQKADTGWTLRMYGVMVDSSTDTRMSLTGVSTGVSVGGGVGVEGEYRLSNKLGLDLSTMFANVNMEMAVSGTGGSSTQSLELGMVPLTLGVMFHLNPDGRADFFVAPTVSYVSYLELETSFGWNSLSARVGDSSDMAIGAALGVDVPFGKGKWSVGTGLRYMATGTNDADVDPLILTLGFGRRF